MKSLPRLSLVVAALSVCALAAAASLPGQASTSTTGSVTGSSSTTHVLITYAPTNLRQPASPADCLNHVYLHGTGYYEHIGYGCSHPTANYIYLIWDYAGARPSGYHVYRTDSGRQDYGIHNDGTVAQVYYPGGRVCYVVTAVTGNNESKDSNQYCVLPTAVRQQAIPISH